jgi:type IV secretion system protein VirB5
MMFKKQKSLVATVVLALSAYAPVVGAAGIPVIDGAHIASTIANHIENIAKWVEQARQMQAQLDEWKKNFEAITGERGMGAIPDELREQLKQVIAEPPGWEAIREKYPTFKDAPKASAVYDVVAKGDARLAALQELAEKRLDQVNSLMQRIDSAEDPAAKQDLANRLSVEQAAIQAAAALTQIVARKQASDIKHAEVEANKEFTCQQFDQDC